jgi:hypothetical protein
MNTAEAVWFTVLFAAVLIWFALGARLFQLLRESHVEVYQSLGSPSLLSNSTKSNWLIMRFLMTGSYRELGDERLTRLCSFMRIFFIAYTVWFIGPVVVMLLSRQTLARRLLELTGTR